MGDVPLTLAYLGPGIWQPAATAGWAIASLVKATAVSWWAKGARQHCMDVTCHWGREKHGRIRLQTACAVVCACSICQMLDAALYTGFIWQ